MPAGVVRFVSWSVARCPSCRLACKGRTAASQRGCDMRTSGAARGAFRLCRDCASLRHPNNRTNESRKSMTRFCMALRAVSAGAVIAASLATFAFAQSWPQKPVRFIVSLGPGSGADIGARLLADRLETLWGQPVVVENRPGGDAVIAINAFISARDDHTMLYTPTSSFTAHPYLHDNVPYDLQELSPVARVSVTLVGFAVPAASKFRSVADFINEVGAQPGKLN